MKWIVLLVSLVLFSVPAYSHAESVKDQLFILIQSHAAAQACELDETSLENSARFIVRYVHENVPVAHVKKVTELTVETIAAQTVKFQDRMTSAACTEFSEIWYEVF